MRGPYVYVMEKMFHEDIRENIDNLGTVIEAKKTRAMLRFTEVSFGVMGVVGARSGPIAEVANDSESMDSRVLETTLDILVAAPTVAASGLAAAVAIEAHLLARRASVRIDELTAS